MAAVTLVVFYSLGSCLKTNDDADHPDARLPGVAEEFLQKAESVDPEVIRMVAHQSVEVYAAFLKLKVDLAVDLWQGLTPAQRRKFVEGFSHLLHVGKAEVERLMPASGLTHSRPSGEG